MKNSILFLAFIIAALTTQAADSTRIQQAKAMAAVGHKYILLSFSGSDWCIPCIKMKKTIFESDAFKREAAGRLILINADFPRNSNKLDISIIRENEALAEAYNKTGTFPFTILLDDKGNVIKGWEGFQNIPAAVFCEQIEKAINDYDISKFGSPAGSKVDGKSF